MPHVRKLFILFCFSALSWGIKAQFTIQDLGSLLDITTSMIQTLEFSPLQDVSLELAGRNDHSYPPRPASHWHFQPHVLYMFTVGDASEYIPDGIGFGGELLTNITGPVLAGIHVTGGKFDQAVDNYTEIFDGQPIDYKEKTASRVLLAHLAVRFEPELQSRFRPYLQGLFGAHWYYTNTKIRDTDAGEVVDRFKEISQAVIGFGVQAGTRIGLDKHGAAGLDLRVGYTANPSVEFMRYSEVPTGTSGYPVDYFETVSSAVQLITVQLGLYVRISGGGM